MHPSASILCGLTASVAAIVVPRWNQGPDAPAPVPAVRLRAPQEPAAGHLVLVVQGSARALRIAHAVAKPDPWAGIPTGECSPVALRILARDGKELACIPVPLAHFDLDERRAEGPPRVCGCEVRSPCIALLLNVPHLADAVVYQFVRGERVLGTTTSQRLAALLGGRR